MAKYKLVFKKSVAKDLRGIPNVDVKKILERIELLVTDPRAEGCIKLSGSDKYRVRQGVYRIIYEIRDTELVVSVIKVGHRSIIYKKGSSC
ncbi:type II toxin-antitoxin system mRNA interferase toxin, RelE/StbE family [Pseudidiomarina tainanensis]|uniref:Type II toxin-antitoxin system mRNA interferase toxin, RelE/StbE family n=1 Tax=Pseudidiomarina tainanensis TaxID=502365 RepID=A0ACD2HHR3_9GAMM|nr:type II toxin-antitoxin system RelE/ParE family toxin [Pseudidiomarina tainanensis]OZB04943.1 MAG: addiction module antitoxin [Idiomarina sp. 34-48-12]RZQ55772.1 type II toxin-antitoxin system mRNA interferase toxin, RelE/StbE family [Pseudidiomarina tainanensis]